MDLNHRFPASKAGRLTKLSHTQFVLVDPLGVEPSCHKATDLQSAAVANAAQNPFVLAPDVGIEPT